MKNEGFGTIRPDFFTPESVISARLLPGFSFNNKHNSNIVDNCRISDIINI